MKSHWAFRILLIAGCAIALMSVGGLGIHLSPLLVVLLYVAATGTRSLIAKAAWVGLAALLAAEGAWGVTYALVEESSPAIWLLPVAAGLVIGVVVFMAGRTPEIVRSSPRG